MANSLKELWKRNQRQVNLVLASSGATPLLVDGDPGPKTAVATYAALKRAPVNANPAPVPEPLPGADELDSRTAKNIATLHPKVRQMFTEIALAGKRIANEIHVGATYKMISGTRTYAEQNKLYAKGRTTGGNRVTNARGGYSNHNFGIAADFGAFDKNGLYLDSGNSSVAAKIHTAVAKWAKENFPDKVEWGGDWSSFVDRPHFQYENGLSTRQMRERVAQGKSVV